MTFDLMQPMPNCGSQLRYVLMEGSLRIRDTNTKTDVYCILFTDMLLFTKSSKRDKLKIVKPPIRIDSLVIHEMKESTNRELSSLSFASNSIACSCNKLGLCVVAYILLVHVTPFEVAQAAYTLHGDNINKWVKAFKKAQVRIPSCMCVKLNYTQLLILYYTCRLCL